MTNDWILDVLTDLKKFSVANQMSKLAEHLDDTIMIASNELSGSRAAASSVGRLDDVRAHAGPYHSGDRT